MTAITTPNFDIIEPKKRRKGQVYGWGCSKGWELGLGEVHDYICKPVKLTDLAKAKIVFVACGGHHSACLSASGELYTFGQNGEGQLGHGNTDVGLFPKKISALKKKKILAVSLGANHSSCITGEKGGTLYTWGKNSHGQLGHKSGSKVLVPTKVETLAGKKVVYSSCGDSHSAAIVLSANNEPDVYSWGNGQFGKLGNESEENLPEPTMVESLGGFIAKRILCGPSCTAVTTDAGDLVTFGNGENGRLGHASDTTLLRPLSIPFLSQYELVDVCVGMDHMAAVTKNGEVFTWGYGSNGRLGHGNEEDKHSPTMVQGLSAIKIVSVSCGGHHTVCVDEKGNLYVMGWNHHGQLGLGKEVQHVEIPTKLEGLDPVLQVATGEFHTIVLVAEEK